MKTIIYLIAAYLAASSAFVGYIVTTTLRAKHLRGDKMPVAAWVLGWYWVLIGVVLDVLLQYTVASLVWRELPPAGEHLLTTRLRRWKRTPGDSQRKRWAIKACNFLNLFDPSGAHC